MGVLGGLLLLAGLVGLVKPGLLRLPNRWAAVGVLVVGVILAAAFSGGPTDNTTAPQPAQQQTQEQAAQPAPQQQPKEEQAQPYTEEELAYASAVMEHGTKLSDTLLTLGTLMQTPDFLNNDWRVKVATYLAQLDLLVEEGMKLKAPASMKAIDDAYKQALKELEKVPDLITRGLDDMDPKLIEQAAVHMNKGTEHMQKVGTEVEKFTSTRSN